MNAGLGREELLGRIQDLVKELLHDVMRRSLPTISIDKFRITNFPNEQSPKYEEKEITIFEKCKQEQISIATSAGARRTTAMLRVLQIIQILLQEDKHSTKRDIYYTDPAILKDQTTVNQALIDICIKLKCTRSSIHVVSVSKGLVMGALRFKESGRITDCCVCKTRGFPVPPDINQVRHISSSADYILVVEKETVFHRLANDGFCIKNNCILITGKGYPDISTRSFLKLLVEELRVPAYILVDADPYGIDILATYRFGSLTMAYDAEALATPSVRWLGMFLSDCNEYNIPNRCLLPLTSRDKGKAEAMLKREYFKHLVPLWSEQLENMLEKGVKLEIEAISATKFSALTEEYIPKKISKKSFL